MKKIEPHPNSSKLIPTHGGYRELRSFQHAELVYDATVRFCDRFIDRRSRTHDQMVQAARSGRQNIAEGSQASGTSKKTELKLVGVARASLEELLLDYEDFIRQRGFILWNKTHPTAQVVRRLAYEKNRSYMSYGSYIEQSSPKSPLTRSSASSTRLITCWISSCVNSNERFLNTAVSPSDSIEKERKDNRSYRTYSSVI